MAKCGGVSEAAIRPLDELRANSHALVDGALCSLSDRVRVLAIIDRGRGLHQTA